MDESCSIQAPSPYCIKEKTRRPKSSRKKSNFLGSPHLAKVCGYSFKTNNLGLAVYQ